MFLCHAFLKYMHPVIQIHKTWHVSVSHVCGGKPKCSATCGDTLIRVLL